MPMRSLLQPSPDATGPAGAGGLWTCAWVTAAGFALYGFAVGFWRSPAMAGYVAVKMPLLIVLTLGCNGLLNGLLGTLLGGLEKKFFLEHWVESATRSLDEPHGKSPEPGPENSR